MTTKGKTGAAILAAGASTRLGAPKQLLDFRGRPLLQHILDQAQPLPLAVSVLVLGAHAAEIRAAVSPGLFRVVVNEQWQEGIASSIRAAVTEALAACPDLENLLFLLSDQPFVTTQILSELLDLQAQSGLSIAACRYGDTLGVPAVFSKKMFPELLLLQGDNGAGRLIRQHAVEVAALPFHAGAVDVDTEEDYRRLTGWSE